MSLVRVQRAAIFVGDEWRSVLPNVAVGFTQEFAHDLHAQGLTDTHLHGIPSRRVVHAAKAAALLPEPLPPGAPAGIFRQVANAPGR